MPCAPDRIGRLGEFDVTENVLVYHMGLVQTKGNMYLLVVAQDRRFVSHAKRLNIQ